jgi:hypothetical protein
VDLGIEVLPLAICASDGVAGSLAITTRCTVLLENRRTMKIDGHFLFPLASFLNGCLNFDRLFDAG